jgi:hypothetical protein
MAAGASAVAQVRRGAVRDASAATFNKDRGPAKPKRPCGVLPPLLIGEKAEVWPLAAFLDPGQDNEELAGILGQQG